MSRGSPRPARRAAADAPWCAPPRSGRGRGGRRPWEDSRGMAERVLTERALNRALLARQLLLEPARLALPRALERIGGIQNQYAPSGYGDLWRDPHLLWMDVVRVPPSGTWERRRADLYALAEDWIGPCDVTEEEGLD